MNAKPCSIHTARAVVWMGMFPLLVGFPLCAQSAMTTALDNLWSRAMLHENDHNPFLQEFKLRGRYHGVTFISAIRFSF